MRPTPTARSIAGLGLRDCRVRWEFDNKRLRRRLFVPCVVCFDAKEGVKRYVRAAGDVEQSVNGGRSVCGGVGGRFCQRLWKKEGRDAPGSCSWRRRRDGRVDGTMVQY